MSSEVRRGQTSEAQQAQQRAAAHCEGIRWF